jgi:hypothetical protein
MFDISYCKSGGVFGLPDIRGSYDTRLLEVRLILIL